MSQLELSEVSIHPILTVTQICKFMSLWIKSLNWRLLHLKYKTLTHVLELLNQVFGALQSSCNGLLQASKLVTCIGALSFKM